MRLFPLFLSSSMAFASADPAVPLSNAQQATDALAAAPLVAFPKPIRTNRDPDAPRFIPNALLAIGGVALAGSAIWYFANTDRVAPDLRDAGVHPFLFKIGAGLAIPIGGLITVGGIGGAMESLHPEP